MQRLYFAAAIYAEFVNAGDELTIRTIFIVIDYVACKNGNGIAENDK